MRRQALFALIGAAVAWQVSADALAQSTGKTAVIGRLHPGSLNDPAQIKFIEAFREGMRAFGYNEGQAYRIEPRYAEGDVAHLPALATDLVQMKVDVIITGGTAAAQAAKSATSSIPIVMATSGPDPVARGLVTSITRPGGNVTGFTAQTDELPVKQLELLREVVMDLTHVLVLHNPKGSLKPDQALPAAATSLGLRLHPVAVIDLYDIDRAFADITAPGRTGVLVLPDPISLDRFRTHIAERALHHRLPMAASFRISAEAGALLSYAEDLADMHRRSAAFVDKIIRGAKPADLPVEQPTKFELVINLKTARTLGIEIPVSIIARADEVIE